MRWWVAVVLVVAVVVTGGVVELQRWRHTRALDQQRADYAAGHAAYLRADCVTALPRLAAARRGHLDRSVANRAATDGTACERYEKVRARALTQPIEPALATYLAYVIGKPRGPLVDTARKQVRALLGKDIAAGTVSYRFCTRRDDLTTPKLVRITPSDDLAGPWLAACAKTLAAAKGWGDARRALVEIQTRLPRSKESKATLAQLATVSARAAATVPDAGRIPDLGSSRSDPGLKGRAGLTLWNGSSWPLDVMIGGDRPRFVRVPACRHCQAGNAKDKNCGVRHRSWKETMVTVPAGRRPLQVWSPSPRHWDFDTVSYDTVRFAPNAEYIFCTWD